MNSDLRLSCDLGFLRVALAVPPLRVGDVDFNVEAIMAAVAKARSAGVQVLALPEMAVTGYTIADLVQHQALLSKVREGLRRLLRESSQDCMVILVGMPLEVEQKIYNCAVVMNSGRILGVVPKTLLPTYKEFYEHRWFVSSASARTDSVEMDGGEVPFGTDILFSLKGVDGAVIGVEICEDLWMPLSPHAYQALAGATVLINISASNDIIAKADWRRTMAASESGRCVAAYCYVSSGVGESTNDLVYGGHSIVAENGIILKESRRLQAEPPMTVADIDLDRLVHDRRVLDSFHDVWGTVPVYRIVETEVVDRAPGELERFLDSHPFVPADPSRRAERCRDIFSMQVAALGQKLSGAGLSRLVLGVSGGLDSTLALLVAAKTMDFLGVPRANVFANTLPGFGTTQRTKTNAINLGHALGVTLEEVDITRSCRSHLEDLGHGSDDDVVFENVQARYRTEFLFNRANQLDAVVLGTGDLTEIALGWCTFSGDHLSHYHVNASVPKTLVQFLIRWVADEELAESEAQKVLYDILATPITPELRRPNGEEIMQMSEEEVGPFELADFYLYPFIRFGTSPGKILYLAEETRRRGLFAGTYTREDLYRWLKSFLVRFFANQFKRTCLPEGPKIGSVSLSPRGDWRMPSEASVRLWLEDLDATYAKMGE